MLARQSPVLACGERKRLGDCHPGTTRHGYDEQILHQMPIL